ncbi:MAG: aminotransferase class I/II-fold pyridoxal phosphate-dependent enzyme [Alloprevotella sp.]|nr:aminotransferase class I/II-fold pyridoxal phosphate-dependent enzyme [Prevotella sp.]MBR1712785.1 aminotransferase class I/II-fold pyridoxal phosphate-dependent enzyme [Alloprevotella sp.]
MQAIILAAGMGRRLGEVTREDTKCMVPVCGQRLIDRTLNALADLGNISRVLIVTGYKADRLKAHIGTRYDDRLKIAYRHNPDYARTNNIYSLSLAKEEMQQEDTLLIESDLIFDPQLLRRLISSPEPDAALVAKYEPWMDGTMVRLDKSGYIVSFVPKRAFSYADADFYYKTVNIYKFSRDFSRNKYVPFLEAYCKAMGNNEYYEQVLRVLTLIDGAGMKAVPADGLKWYEIDDVQDLDIAETIFADKEEIMRRYNQRYGGHWRFPRMLDFCYLVNPYFPTERMRDELRANFDTLLTEYPSGMYVNSLLAGKYFGVKQEHIVVGNGAAELIKSLMEKTKGRVGIPFPTFEEYPNRREGTDIEPFLTSDPDLRYSADDLMSFFADKDISALLLINPDNPSGNFIPKADVLRLAAWAEQQGVRLVVDESFVDFSEGFRDNSLLNEEVLRQYPHLIVVKSISKSYGVPGLRLGVLASADQPLVDWIKHDVSIWNINSFAEFYMQIYGKYVADYDHACDCFVEERKRFMNRLSKVPFLRVLPSQANYFLCQVLPPYTSAELTRQLLMKHDILIRDCNTKKTLEGRNVVRIAVRDSKDNDQLVEALKHL